MLAFASRSGGGHAGPAPSGRHFGRHQPDRPERPVWNADHEPVFSSVKCERLRLPGGAILAGVSATFAERFAAARKQMGPLVFGLDPSAELLSAWGLGSDPDGLDRFVDRVLEAAVGTVGLVKPQSAFYEPP